MELTKRKLKNLITKPNIKIQNKEDNKNDFVNKIYFSENEKIKELESKISYLNSSMIEQNNSLALRIRT